MSWKKVVADGINKVLRPAGVQLVAGYSPDPGIQPFLSARKTIAAAERARLSVGDYIDQTYNEPGTSAATVDAMLRLSELVEPVARVCEIGPGSGRYAVHVIAALHPGVYEVYETALDWLPHLRKLPNLITQPADGRTLASTESESVELVQAHKVFNYIPFMTTVGYLREMARVVRRGGVVAFDVVTENCLDEATLDVWATRGTLYLSTPRAWVIDFMARRQLSLRGNFFAAMNGGRTELLVFRKV